MSLSLILATEGISAPLTGIGRYGLELAQGLSAHPQVDALRFFAYGRFVPPPDPSRLQGPGAPLRRGLLHSTLSGNGAAVRVYHRLMPRLSRWRLRDEGDALFHSPSYFLPPVPGASVATVHDLSHVLYPEFHPAARVAYMNLAFPDTLRRATHLITDAKSVRQELIERLGVAPGRVTAVPLGVDAAFRPRAPQELAPLLQRLGLVAQGYALCVGTIEPRKNVARLLSAYEALPMALRSDCPLVLAGAAGWRSAETHARIEKARGEGWLHYLSYVEQQDLPLLYAGARLFVYPSLYEGFGLPVLEAMASGTPVITSNLASLPEVAGDAARLVDPQDVDALAAALLAGLQDEHWRSQSRQAGLSRASQFSWSACVNATVAVYRKTLGR